MSLPAELAYLFRHAVIRDAAYGLHPPSARAALHAMALEILEALARPETLDAWAEELADHARRALGADGADRESLQRRELDYLQRGAEHESRHWHNERSVALRERIVAHPLASDAQRIRALLDTVETLMRSGGMSKTGPLLEQAWEIAQAAGEPRDIALTLAARAQAATLQSRHEEARRLIEQGIPAAAAIGDRDIHARLLITRAANAQGVGDWALGEQAAREAWELLKDSGNLVSKARSQLYLGDACWEQGKLEQAAAHFEEALQIYLQAENLGGEASARDHLGSLLRELRRDDEAKRNHERAAELYSHMGDSVGYGSAVSNLATLLQEEGRFDEARRYRLQALKNFRAAGAMYMEGVALGNLASSARIQGRLEEASRLFQAARNVLRRIGRVVEHAVFEANFGHLLLLMGFVDAAHVNARQASDDLTRVQVIAWREQYATMLEVRVAVERMRQGSHEAARTADDLLRRMRDCVEEGQDSILAQTVAKAEALREEALKPQPLLFRGHLVSELPAPLRLALLDRMRKTEPEEWRQLQANPALHDAMRAGTEDLPVPDWQTAGEL
ncbi:MAG: tetratricopeptide repeat protein [Planctomycetes bacterium]|nr:tetratricopeptide repeat protein [Planctomycetota bacterium]MCB9936305.1 tetratricopeptide repeat protein [Planctomycetota bacterium]